LLFGITVLHPGRIGNEFYMTKGHFHAVRDTAEVYSTLQGRGVLLLEEEHGSATYLEFAPGRTLYIPPGYAHRSVNTGDTNLVFAYYCPAHAGHDYATIEQRGFKQRVLEINQQLVIRRTGA
jgi:glucose-6-phosphate isomerase